MMGGIGVAAKFSAHDDARRSRTSKNGIELASVKLHGNMVGTVWDAAI